MFTSFFKREPQGKYESTFKFTKGIRLTKTTLLDNWVWISPAIIGECHQVLLSKKFSSRKE